MVGNMFPLLKKSRKISESCSKIAKIDAANADILTFDCGLKATMSVNKFKLIPVLKLIEGIHVVC